MRCLLCDSELEGTAHVCVPTFWPSNSTSGAVPPTALPSDDLVQRRIKLARRILDGECDDLVLGS